MFKVGDFFQYVSDPNDVSVLNNQYGVVLKIDRDAERYPYLVSFPKVKSGWDGEGKVPPGSWRLTDTKNIRKVGYDEWRKNTVEEDKVEVKEDVGEYQTILQEAQSLVYGNRNADYGHPHDDYVKNATFLTTILKDKLADGAVITPQDVCIFMICLKVSRLINDHTKRDSIVDVAGYAECLSRINRREEGLE